MSNVVTVLSEQIALVVINALNVLPEQIALVIILVGGLSITLLLFCLKNHFRSKSTFIESEQKKRKGSVENAKAL